MQAQRSEIRQSKIRGLLDKVRKNSYDKYLISLRLERIRMFSGSTIKFDFPVTALVGPNGGGKTTILGACGCIFSRNIQQKVFQRSRIGDESMKHWQINYDIVDRSKSTSGSILGELKYDGQSWINSEAFERRVAFLGLVRTLPLSESPDFHLRSRLTKDKPKHKLGTIEMTKLEDNTTENIKREGERVLGKSLHDYDFYRIVATQQKHKKIRFKEKIVLPDGRLAMVFNESGEEVIRKNIIDQTMCVGSNGEERYSELNFGAGESSVLRVISEIESIKDGSLVLIDEIENGLHPLAVRQFVEYLIDVAARKRVQVIFTTHSDYALDPLPGEAIWACLDGRLQQGKLSVEALRVVSGRIDKKLAIFVEDDFASHWILAVLRERLGDRIDEIGVYAVGGDGNAVKTHLAHMANPAVSFRSRCFIDGDSKQSELIEKGIFRLPGCAPEATVFDEVLQNIHDNIARLTLACQRPLEKQGEVENAIRSVSHTNRDPHLLFAQVGEKIGFTSELIIRGAFLAVWIGERKQAVDAIVDAIEFYSQR